MPKITTQVSSRNMNTTIYITDAMSVGYEYKDDVRRGSTSHIIAWHGQRKGRCDKYVGIGTGVFYRKKTTEPFMWLGRINHQDLLASGNPDNSEPSIYLLKIPFDNDTFRIFHPKDNGTGCFKRAAQEGMGYKISKDVFSGIIYHSR